MLKIMYGILPFESQLMLGDMKNHDELKTLVGFSFQENAIIHTKFIADTTDGVIFSALVTNNCKVNYPRFEGRIESVFIDERQQRFSTTTVPLQTDSSTRIFIKLHKQNRKRTRKKGEGQILSNAERKRIRKENNLCLSEANWKQFVRKRKSVLNLFFKNAKEIEPNVISMN